VVNTGERTVTFASDANGFRVSQDGPTRANSRIFLIGDSMMEALQVTYEQSVAGLLEKGLLGLTGKPTAVCNAAVGGWGPSQYLIETRHQLQGQDYALVLVMIYLGNDIERVRRDHYPPHVADEVRRFRIPRHLSWREFVDAVAYPINDALKVRSHLFVLLKNGLPTLRARLGLNAFYFPVEYMKVEASSPRWEVTADVLSDISGLAKSRGVPSLFVLLPAPFQVDSATFNDYVRRFHFNPADADLDQPNRLMLAALRKRGLDVIDVLPDLRKAQRRSPGRLYGSVDNHLSPEGHEVVARSIMTEVAARISGAR
jgi:hypothetical protein